MSDVRAAAERLRRYAEVIVDGIEKTESEHSTSYQCKEHCRMGLAEAYELARAYLSEHPSDDSELLTEEWLRAVGFETYGALSDYQGGVSIGGLGFHELREWRWNDRPLESCAAKTCGDWRLRWGSS